MRGKKQPDSFDLPSAQVCKAVCDSSAMCADNTTTCRLRHSDIFFSGNRWSLANAKGEEIDGR